MLKSILLLYSKLLNLSIASKRLIIQLDAWLILMPHEVRTSQLSRHFVTSHCLLFQPMVKRSVMNAQTNPLLNSLQKTKTICLDVILWWCITTSRL
jgi:hypothetical protein